MRWQEYIRFYSADDSDLLFSELALESDGWILSYSLRKKDVFSISRTYAYLEEKQESCSPNKALDRLVISADDSLQHF